MWAGIEWESGPATVDAAELFYCWLYSLDPVLSL
jgi:hypothetical protein